MNDNQNNVTWPLAMVMIVFLLCVTVLVIHWT